MARSSRALLSFARLQGASLDHAELQGALLDRAQLQGASLENAKLQGARLGNAQLQGAQLRGVQLQGAQLRGTQLQGASLEKVYVWRADARKAAWADTRVISPATDPMSVESFEKLKRLSAIAEQVPAGYFTLATLTIKERLDPMKPVEGEDEMAKVWKTQAGSSPATEVYERRLVEIWSDVGCGAEGPYVLRGLLVHLEGGHSPFRRQSPQLPALAKAFLDEEHCPGAHGLTEPEKARLKEIRDRSPPPASKQ
jgi:Pentapeptide repeats (8 copies)